MASVADVAIRNCNSVLQTESVYCPKGHKRHIKVRYAPTREPNQRNAAALSTFVLARPDTIVRRLSVHRGSRNTLDLTSCVVNDGQLFCAGGKRIWNFFVGSHFSFLISVW